MWINIDERYPEEGQEVVIEYKNNTGVWKDVANYISGRWWLNSAIYGLKLNVIRWFPLPS